MVTVHVRRAELDFLVSLLAGVAGAKRAQRASAERKEGLDT